MGVLAVCAWLRLREFENTDLQICIDKFLNRLLGQTGFSIKSYFSDRSEPS